MRTDIENPDYDPGLDQAIRRKLDSYQHNYTIKLVSLASNMIDLLMLYEGRSIAESKARIAAYFAMGPLGVETPEQTARIEARVPPKNAQVVSFQQFRKSRHAEMPTSRELREAETS